MFCYCACHAERELVLELERMRKKVGGGKSKKDAPLSRLDNYTRALEEERDYYKGEVEVLNRILKSKGAGGGGGGSSTPSKARERSPKKSSTPVKGSRSSSPSHSAIKGAKVRIVLWTLALISKKHAINYCYYNIIYFSIDSNCTIAT